MSDAEKKQAWYIANAQGYCLEFRLSENTVSSYDTYKTEVARIVGMTFDQYATAVDNRTYSGWMVFREWLISEGFSGGDWHDNTTGSAKGGSNALFAALHGVVSTNIGSQKSIVGALPGLDNKTHGNGRGGDSECSLDWGHPGWLIEDEPWNHYGALPILLVRPL